MNGAGRTLYDLDRASLTRILADEPGYRLEQLWSGLYAQFRDPGQITVLPASLRDRIALDAPTALTPVTESVSDGGDTVKFLWRLSGGAMIETVLMHYPGTAEQKPRTTVCVSTQAGCAMACGFCATGQAGFERQLSGGEIIEQVARAARRAAEHADHERRVSNVVFMGMGEPMANFDNTWAAIRRIHDDMGIGARHLTISTVGIVPGIRRLAEAELPVNLAVSLHAADDGLRNELVPINRRYPLAELLEACGDYYLMTGRRISFEWALISEVNDRFADADRLARLCTPLGAHVNLIPLNPTPGFTVRGSSRNRVHAFRDRLRSAGVNTTIRDTRGTDIDAACGQLRAGHEVRH